MKKLFVSLFIGATSLFSFAQSSTDFEKIGYLLSDALFYSDNYITPITDAAVYQASSGWFFTPKKQDNWTVHVNVNTNIFSVPKKDRTFAINNSDFQFFEIENQNSAVVPTALGDESQVYLVGDLGNEQVRFKTPKGVNQETIIYPYIQASLALPYGFEVIGRYSTKTKLKKGYYQVYGAGLKYNLSQHMEKLQAKNIHLAVASIYSNEDVSFDFLDINTAYGTLGFNQINGIVNTWHFNVLASKEFKNFEIVSNFILNTSTFDYRVNGPKGSIEEIIPAQEIINTQLDQIERNKTNYMLELSGIYYINKFALHSSFAFGKFANLNIGVQYKIK